MKKSINIDKEIIYDLYIIQNLTTKEIATQLNCSTATIARILKQYEIKKDNSLRAAKISKTIQSRTEEEQQLYSQHISESRKGKGLGIDPWNKGKHVGNSWNGKHHSEETKKKISETKQNKSEAEKAEIEAKRLASRAYGEPWNKGKQMSEEQKEKIRETLSSKTAEEWQEIINKQYETKKEHGTTSTSKAEIAFNNKLISIFGIDDVIWHYSEDKRYPFECDFYIKSLDLFIELNISWTHGGHPFNPLDMADIEKLESWKVKATTSDYYKNAIETWTVRDVKKHEAVKNNNLNYIEYYSELELEK